MGATTWRERLLAALDDGEFSRLRRETLLAMVESVYGAALEGEATEWTPLHQALLLGSRLCCRWGSLVEDGFIPRWSMKRWALSGVDLYRADLEDADLSWADLRAATLVEACLDGANLACAGLQRANLQTARLHWACVVEADLRGANLAGASLVGANCYRADFRNCNLQGADFEGACLQEANLSGADLTGAHLGWADIRGVEQADLGLSPAVSPGRSPAERRAPRDKRQLFLPFDRRPPA